MRGEFRYEGHRPDRAAIRAVFRNANGPLGRDLDARARRVEAAARRLVGVKSGRLRNSIRREGGANQFGQYVHIVAGVPGRTHYLGYHLFGTGPHIIRARRAKALRFEVGGRVVYAKSVRHPGTRANPFLQEALTAAY